MRNVVEKQLAILEAEVKLIFPHGTCQEMTKVVHHHTKYGEALHCVALGAAKKLVMLILHRYSL